MLKGEKLLVNPVWVYEQMEIDFPMKPMEDHHYV
jgi:hypothetical protein